MDALLIPDIVKLLPKQKFVNMKRIKTIGIENHGTGNAVTRNGSLHQMKDTI